MSHRFGFTLSLLVAIVLFVSFSALADTTAVTAWVQRYNGSANQDDWASAIAVDGSGNIYVTGRSWSSGTFLDYATMKYDNNGTELWVKRYNSPNNDMDGANAIAVDGSGSVYVTGGSVGSGIYYDYATIKYDTDGNELWAKRYNGPGNGNDVARATEVDGSGNVYVTGDSWGSGTSRDYATIKYDPNGNQLWVKRYNGPGNGDDLARATAVDGLGNVYVTGYSTGSGTYEDYATIKYDPNGNELWVKRYNGPGNGDDETFAIVVDDSGNAYVTGWSVGSGTSGDYATIKYDPNGNELWVKRYNGPGNYYDAATAIAVDGSGNVYVTGGSSGVSYPDYTTIKYDPDGNELWVKEYGTEFTDDGASAIAMDDSGNVYVTGHSVGNELNYDYATIKYDPNGNELWVKRYNGPANSDDWALAIAVDGSSNVYISGGSSGSGTGIDYATIKYITITCLCGDANQDAIVDIGDIVYLINYVFYGGAEPQPNLYCNDVNADGVVDIGDIVYLINYVFYGGAEPSCQ
jgi:hypothetical protein